MSCNAHIEPDQDPRPIQPVKNPLVFLSFRSRNLEPPIVTKSILLTPLSDKLNDTSLLDDLLLRTVWCKR